MRMVREGPGTELSLGAPCVEVPGSMREGMEGLGQDALRASAGGTEVARSCTSR